MGDSRSIFRIFIPVRDFDEALAFYQRLFAQERRTIHRGRHYFDCGGVILAVVENNGTPIGDHIYFSVEGIEAIFERARELGCLERSDVHGSPSDEIAVRPWGETLVLCPRPVWKRAMLRPGKHTLYRRTITVRGNVRKSPSSRLTHFPIIHTI